MRLALCFLVGLLIFPIAQSFALPEVEGRVFFVAPDGSDTASGETVEEATSLDAAFARVGDAVVMRGGTYRTGDLLLNQGITFQAYNDEPPIWKGTRVAKDWTELRDGV